MPNLFRYVNVKKYYNLAILAYITVDNVGVV